MVVYSNLLIGDAVCRISTLKSNTVGRAHSPGLDAETTLAPQRGRRPLTATCARRPQRTSNPHNRGIRWPAKATGRT
jgi:hypothetical protein